MVSIELGAMIAIVAMAFIMETIDSSIGMMYGTILSPVLVLAGYQPLVVVPAILISQAIGGIVSTYGHHQWENASFTLNSHDTKVMLSMFAPGVLFTILGVYLALTIDAFWVLFYIAAIVIAMGVLCFTPIGNKFKWWVQGGLGIFGSVNKAFMGGGFGPLNTTGGVLNGLKTQVSIATTNFAEVGICLAGFALYLMFGKPLDWGFTGLLCVGAFLGGCAGPYIASKLDHLKMRRIVGIAAIISGVFMLAKLYGYI